MFRSPPTLITYLTLLGSLQPLFDPSRPCLVSYKVNRKIRLNSINLLHSPGAYQRSLKRIPISKILPALFFFIIKLID